MILRISNYRAPPPLSSPAPPIGPPSGQQSSCNALQSRPSSELQIRESNISRPLPNTCLAKTKTISPKIANHSQTSQTKPTLPAPPD
nr:hypothetical protein Itr_chr15CG14950 [Ipomoea trifida]